MSITIKLMTYDDINVIVKAFTKHNWFKPHSTFEGYLAEQKADERMVWLAHFDNQLAGYVTLKYLSQYKPFKVASIPEIMDLNVLPPLRNNGIGSKLLETAEYESSKRGDVVGLGVGLYDGYGSAQRLYIAKGYIPDGLGITYNYNTVAYGERAPLDDDLVLWFTKKLKMGSNE